MASTSVVVPLHNGRDLVATCLASVPRDVELIVVDDLSTDGAPELVAGRFPQALAAFQAASRRDPGDRAARVAVSRVRSEMRMTATERPAPVLPPGNKGLPPPPDETILTRVERVVEFQDTVGDERERLGRIQAMQGRIEQLLAERKVAQFRHRAFAKNAELHALSRRLS